MTRRKEKGLTDALGKITQPRLYPVFLCQSPDRIVFVIPLDPLSPDLNGLERVVRPRGTDVVMRSKLTALQASTDLVVGFDDQEIGDTVGFEFLRGGDSGDTCSEN